MSRKQLGIVFDRRAAASFITTDVTPRMGSQTKLDKPEKLLIERKR
jgi:hypothetical protein